MKAAIIVLSDPNAGEEALGRLFNALAAAYDFKQRAHEIVVLFQGAGTRWAQLLEEEDHPAHALYRAVANEVIGVSHACAGVFGAKEGAVENGFELISTNAVPDTAGLPSLARYSEQGYAVLTF